MSFVFLILLIACARELILERLKRTLYLKQVQENLSGEKVENVTKLKYGIALVSMLILWMIFYPATNIMSQASGEKFGGTLRIALGGEPGTLFPTTTTSYSTHAIVDSVYETLIGLDLNWNFVPRLAETWTVSTDALKYTFNLVRNATWHDGAPFTAADVKFTFEEAIYKYAPTGYVFKNNIGSIETPDNYTVVFNMKQVYSPLLTDLAYPVWSCIIPAHLYNGTDIVKNPTNWFPIGTGPFMFVEYVKGDHVSLARNPSYYRSPLPYLDGVIIRIIKDATARVMAFQAGEVNVLGIGTPLSMVQQMAALPGVAYSSDCAAGWAPVVEQRLNQGPLGNDALKDRRVRQALAYSIDKEAIKMDCYFGLVTIADSEIHPSLPMYNASAVKVYTYDLSKADALLNEAGYPKDSSGKRFKLRVVIDVGYDDRLKAMEIWRESLGTLGIELEIMPLDTPAVLQRVCVSGDYDILLSVSWAGPDPIVALGRYLVSWNIKPGTVWANYAFINNTEIDKIFSQLPTETDPAKIKSLWSKYQEIETTECYGIETVANPYVQIVRDYVNVKDLFYVCTNYLNTYWTKGKTQAAPDTAMEDLTAKVSELTSALDTTRNIAYASTILAIAAVLVTGISLFRKRR